MMLKLKNFESILIELQIILQNIISNANLGLYNTLPEFSKETSSEPHVLLGKVLNSAEVEFPRLQQIYPSEL